uniref:Purine nucleoside phosphorylase n=1 Tax=Heterorhabditis bacteriophora TaxID=37862 RepID=A0A1I7W9C6_HETBA
MSHTIIIPHDHVKMVKISKNIITIFSETYRL